MQIHRIRGKNLTDALRRAREAHGDGAVVLSQETVANGGVTIAVAEPARIRRGRARASASRKRTPGLDDVRRRLLEHGASKALTDRVAAAVERTGVQGMYALDVAARVIGKVLPVRTSPKRDGTTRIIALVGPTGGGKTTTLAKLGRKLFSANRRVRFASLDPVGVGSLEALDRAAAATDRHEIPIAAVSSAEELDEAAAVRAGIDAILLDTPGVPLRESEPLESLARELGGLGKVARSEVYLVLPATASRAALDDAIAAFAPMNPAGAIITKLDETARPTPALERCLRAKLPIAFLCDGQDVRGHLRRARGDHFADLLLRGRISR